jgi:hypothetical protein
MTDIKKSKKRSVWIPTIAIITKALNEPVQDAIEVHRRANLPLVVWKNGQIELISADSIPALPQRKPRR